MAAVDLRASKTGYLTLDQAAAIRDGIPLTVCPCSNHDARRLRRFVLPRDRARVRPHRGRVRPPRAQFARGDLRLTRRKGSARGKAPRLLRGLLRVIGCTYCTAFVNILSHIFINLREEYPIFHILTINYGRKYKHAFRPSKSRRAFRIRGSFANK